MTSTFRLLLAAMPDIASACERINDPQLRDRAFDALVAEARMGGAEVPYDRAYGGTTWNTTEPISAPTVGTSAYDPTSTRVDNGSLRG